MYNGWTNYWTWRVMLETFADDTDSFVDDSTGRDVHSLKEYLKEYFIEVNFPDGLGKVNIAQWPHNIMDQVNWLEIAETILVNYDETHCLNCKNYTDDTFCTRSCEDEHRYAGTI